MQESSDGIEAVIFERVVQVIAEIRIIVQNHQVHRTNQAGTIGAHAFA
jgi:hypothetical protein